MSILLLYIGWESVRNWVGFYIRNIYYILYNLLTNKYLQKEIICVWECKIVDV